MWDDKTGQTTDVLQMFQYTVELYSKDLPRYEVLLKLFDCALATSFLFFFLSFPESAMSMLLQHGHICALQVIIIIVLRLQRSLFSILTKSVTRYIHLAYAAAM